MERARGACAEIQVCTGGAGCASMPDVPRVALCIAGELRDHIESVHSDLVRMIRSWPMRVDVFIDTWSLGMANTSATPWLRNRRRANLVVNESFAFWSSLYDTEASSLVHLRVEHARTNSAYSLHGLTMPSWLVQASERRHGFGGTLPLDDDR